MDSVDTKFVVGSQVALYGNLTSTATTKSPASSRRSFVDLVRDAAMAGIAVAVMGAAMVPSARAQDAQPLQSAQDAGALQSADAWGGWHNPDPEVVDPWIETDTGLPMQLASMNSAGPSGVVGAGAPAGMVWTHRDKDANTASSQPAVPDDLVIAAQKPSTARDVYQHALVEVENFDAQNTATAEDEIKQAGGIAVYSVQQFELGSDDPDNNKVYRIVVSDYHDVIEHNAENSNMRKQVMGSVGAEGGPQSLSVALEMASHYPDIQVMTRHQALGQEQALNKFHYTEWVPPSP